eukprot:c6312_g1_i3.p1 GENE.c6312_g1_i3~~c6312_g1_i3.p1  ORF type:complete len:477 (+),score=87.52 c6312_g1_i3:52-1431(+)
MHTTPTCLRECALRLKFSPETTGCALKCLHFWNNFFANKPCTSSIQMIISACLLLAGKANEQIRRIRDVLNVTHSVMQKSLPNLDDELIQMKKEVIASEDMLLRILNFDIPCHTPHKIAMALCVSMQVTHQTMTAALSLINDILIDPISIKFSDRQIAIACIHLAALITKEHISSVMGAPSAPIAEWWQMFGLTTNQMHEIQQVFARWQSLIPIQTTQVSQTSSSTSPAPRQQSVLTPTPPSRPYPFTPSPQPPPAHHTSASHSNTNTAHPPLLTLPNSSHHNVSQHNASHTKQISPLSQIQSSPHRHHQQQLPSDSQANSRAKLFQADSPSRSPSRRRSLSRSPPRKYSRMDSSNPSNSNYSGSPHRSSRRRSTSRESSRSPNQYNRDERRSESHHSSESHFRRHSDHHSHTHTQQHSRDSNTHSRRLSHPSHNSSHSPIRSQHNSRLSDSRRYHTKQ